MTPLIHHLNCSTLRPPCARFINGNGGFLSRGRLVCHCLLIETNSGLVLVDTGLGLRYVDNPKLLGRLVHFMIKAPSDPAETTARQIVQLGFAHKDVRHIVLTHLDLDHAGGLPDFPNAQVHVLAQEYDAAMNPPTSQESRRYVSDQWAHGPNWVVHEAQGEQWYGFQNVQEILPEVLFVPMIGHTRGHCGVAVNTSGGWFFHCGDTYTDRAEVDPDRGRCPPIAKWYQKVIPVDSVANAQHQENVRKLVQNHEGVVSVGCSHDPVEFARYHECD